MHSLRDLHEINAYGADHVCLSVCLYVTAWELLYIGRV
jgi:hypothetical protein